MGYMHIDNLYKNQKVLLCKGLYAMEKIHGTSAHIGYRNDTISYFSGGAKHDIFLAIFDHDRLMHLFVDLGQTDITVYGEAYGAKVNGMRETYGESLRFVVFDVKIDKTWLRVPDAEDVAQKLGLEFVDYKQVSSDLEAIDAERDRDSTQAIRNGIGAGKMREGVVLRPLEELRDSRGNRIMAKHKRDEFMEHRTKRKVVDPAKLKVLQEAQSIAIEWVTLMRLTHVLDKMPEAEPNIEDTGKVIKAMVEDVTREAKGEIVDSKQARTEIGKATAKLFKKHLQARLGAV